jgi:dihydrofolate reductase
MTNIVYIATSTDGFIATKDGGVDWLMEVPNTDNSDYGFAEFMDSIDALVMGRKTYEKVLSFDCEWPYSKKVFVLSNSLNKVDPSVEGKVKVIRGSLNDVIKQLNNDGYKKLYIDGGTTIRGFLKENLIDEMIITKVPVNLGEGIPLFQNNDHESKFKLSSTKTYENGMVKYHYKRVSS